MKTMGLRAHSLMDRISGFGPEDGSSILPGLVRFSNI